MFIQMWQIGTILALSFLFGWRIGWVNGKGHAWEKMDKSQGELEHGEPPAQ